MQSLNLQRKLESQCCRGKLTATTFPQALISFWAMIYIVLLAVPPALSTMYQIKGPQIPIMPSPISFPGCCQNYFTKMHMLSYHLLAYAFQWLQLLVEWNSNARSVFWRKPCSGPPTCMWGSTCTELFRYQGCLAPFHRTMVLVSLMADCMLVVLAYHISAVRCSQVSYRRTSMLHCMQEGPWTLSKWSDSPAPQTLG